MPTAIPIIINPGAGEKDDFPKEILEHPLLEGHRLSTGKPEEAYTLAKKLAGQASKPAGQASAQAAQGSAPATRTPIIAVYGGDGTVMEVARALYQTDVALAILPGGTANVMAKELEIPLDLEKAVNLLIGEHTIRKIDMGLVNGCPFLIRVNMGLFADMITETEPELKEKWGQLAYGLTAYKTIGREPMTFQLTIDGQSMDQDAVALTVTNAGNVGKAGYSFLPDISVTDGLLDVIAMDKADISSLLSVTGSILFGRESGALKHWRAKEVSIRMPAGSTWLCDDAEENAAELIITVAPASLNVLVPKSKEE